VTGHAGGVAWAALMMRAVCRGIVRVPGLLLLAVFRIWQLVVSPTYGDVCRFYPSCSAYGVEAVRVHGAVRGGWLAVRRIARCHPWNPGGVDPVPPTSDRRHAACPATSELATDDVSPPLRRAA
jgi:putative membrane protein insertion efficiency factor